MARGRPDCVDPIRRIVTSNVLVDVEIVVLLLDRPGEPIVAQRLEQMPHRVARRLGPVVARDTRRGVQAVDIAVVEIE